ncbi:hypothetical protein VNI00_007370 [Paramarasmius palmivorus]|uniref:Cyclin-like domain-containing protein n=1 Tax=Paramarasmius palmivorus TaxID=297713 RepID=A0AAW0D245_9AGAR
MATVYPGSIQQQPPSDPKKAALANNNRSRMSFQPMPPTHQATATHTRPDPFYGHEVNARLCARFITHLFACPEYPPTTTQSHAKLPYFIAYALHRTKLHPSVTFAALVLLQRLKARFPTARGSSGHRLFISAFMIASKVICDDTYSNKSWTIVAQGMFTLREINQMEREMCNYLDWELTVDNPILQNFMDAVTIDFKNPQGPYPTYSLQMVSKRAAKAANSTTATPIPEPNSTTSPIPSFGQQQRHSSPAGSADSSPVPTRKNSYSSSPMSEAPSPSYSNNTSPASSASPQTPIGPEDFTAKVHGYGTPRGFAISEGVPTQHPLKMKMFAHAMPCGW